MLVTQSRPRTLKWFHAGPLLYGDWGTSRLYVLGLAFFFTSAETPFYLLAIALLMGAVAWAYTIVCRRFPHGRGLGLTGYGSSPAAGAATGRGAHNDLTKPAGAGEILDALGRDPEDSADLPEAPPSLQRLEWEHIQRVLDAHHGNISRAAEALGIHRRTLQRRLKKRPSPSHFQRR